MLKVGSWKLFNAGLGCAVADTPYRRERDVMNLESYDPSVEYDGYIQDQEKRYKEIIKNKRCEDCHFCHKPSYDGFKNLDEEIGWCTVNHSFVDPIDSVEEIECDCFL